MTAFGNKSRCRRSGIEPDVEKEREIEQLKGRVQESMQEVANGIATKMTECEGELEEIGE